MILYAPIIDTRVPGFSASAPELIKIKFTHNRAVNQSEVCGMSVLIKPYKSDATPYELLADADEIDWEKQVVTVTTFQATDERSFAPKLGQYYHVQIAYIDSDGETGPYSALGISRCAANRNTKLNIETQGHYQTYTARYTTTLTNETVAQYRFVFINLSDDEVIEDSGWQPSLNNAIEYEPTQDISENFQISCSIITINGYELTDSVDCDQNLYIQTSHTILCRQSPKAIEEGYIIIEFPRAQAKYGQLKRYNVTQGGYTKLGQVAAYGTAITQYCDFMVEQGVEYLYFLDTVDEQGQYVTRWLLNNGEPIVANFDDILLADENCQLRIAFNPQISSFKESILEAKQNTIGGKYPYFFRNGQVGYKEFSISGLISYWLDNNALFSIETPRGVETTRVNTPDDTLDSDAMPLSRNLTYDNFQRERQFKLKVLEWLNNGKPKYLRTPAEGNYVIQLTGVSLSPNTTLGRMLHSFSATACEIATSWFDVCDKPICQGGLSDA